MGMNLSEGSPSALLGNFIPVSGPPSRPASAQRTRTDVGLHIHLNLTDSQMDHLTHALPGYCSPQKPQRRQRALDASEMVQSGLPRYHFNGSEGFRYLAESARARHAANPVDESRHGPDAVDTIRFSRSAHDHTVGTHERCNEADSMRRRRIPAPTDQGFHHGDHDRPAGQDDAFSSRARASRSRSPMKRSRSPARPQPIPCYMASDFNLTERRHNHRPAAIDIDDVRQYGSVSRKAITVESPSQCQSQRFDICPPNTPPTPLRRVPKTLGLPMSDSGQDECSSYYSEEEFGQARPSYVSPLRVHKNGDINNTAVLLFRSLSGNSPSSERSPNCYSHSPQRETRRGLQKVATTGDLHQQKPAQMPRNYSPLSDYLSSRLSVRRKEMVGRHGWLERTNSPDKQAELEKNAAQQQKKKKGFLNNLKQLAKDITSDITASASRNKFREKDSHVARLTVSLDPREQSLLYCELEFLLTTALESYINSQFSAGRLDADKYKKIVDGWQQRGRPKVVGFRYDLETQLNLVLLHIGDFRFYGKRAGLIAAVNGVLDMMRVDSRVIRIRTFCQPDTVVAKQLLDAQSLFNLIGCCEKQQIQLAEVIQFFKVILEREQNFRRFKDGERPDEEE